MGSGSEHHVLYQYQLLNTKNIFMGQIQSETPYMQPNPAAPFPFVNPAKGMQDPDFSHCPSNETVSQIGSPKGACGMAWGLRIVDSSNIVVYGAGLYSFFSNYNTTCSQGPFGKNNCQSRMTSIEGEACADSVVLYDYTTIGSVSMVTQDSKEVALAKDNWNTFGETLAMFKA